MRKNPRARKLATRLLAICRDDEGLLSADKVGEVLAALHAKPPRDYRDVLHYLAFLAEREIAASTARVTSGKALSESSIESIRSRFSAKYGRSITVENHEDPSMIAGTRVQVGDDVYEISIPSRLAAVGS
ncbi:F0F1 ATP synthase subunit delta [Puniceicoccus vermicola]|uniref:F0F1 ATP synthase subunit delta n=1 Tax=Puniceicoccus vermicola TaxID=388746 RepID=A0A7X1AWT9_9BACT|nr:F0F1 ATP synthase subunit delta [Puniceicoccus vermicola]MBC2600270.1 F0F1 ATP synthase subunit delta [Puniceicoccus vermicola]